MSERSESQQSNVPRKRGRGQLSLVEHALCPLDARISLQPNLTYFSEYHYFDRHGNRGTASARVDCPNGLSANDEFFLWGLLALTFAEREPGIEFRATPHFCLRQLGHTSKPGGKEHRIFRDALRRLAAVNYQSEDFYDPIRAERCSVSFGFLSYRLPLQSDSSRAWRIVWNPIFFEFCQASGGSLEFDLKIYQELDEASRRLFLLLRKVFWKRTTSPNFEVRHLGVNVLGYSDTLQTKHLKARIVACARKLLEHGVIELPDGICSVAGIFERQKKGVFRVRFSRGRYFDAQPLAGRQQINVKESRFYEPLVSIGFDDAAIGRIVNGYKPHLIDEWADITLAAIERFGSGFFKRSPQAYFMDNVKNSASGTRGVPEWWHDLRKEEDRREGEMNRDKAKEAKSAGQDVAKREFADFLKGEGRATFERVVGTVLDDLRRAGTSSEDVKRKARDLALDHMRKQFVGRQKPGQDVWKLIH